MKAPPSVEEAAQNLGRLLATGSFLPDPDVDDSFRSAASHEPDQFESFYSACSQPDKAGYQRQHAAVVASGDQLGGALLFLEASIREIQRLATAPSLDATIAEEAAKRLQAALERGEAVMGVISRRVSGEEGGRRGQKRRVGADGGAPGGSGSQPGPSGDAKRARQCTAQDRGTGCTAALAGSASATTASDGDPTQPMPPDLNQPAAATQGAHQPSTHQAAQQTATQQTATQQTATQQTAAQPTAAQPTAAQPTAAQPTAAQPTAAQPTAAQPTAAQPTATQPTATQPTAIQTAAHQAAAPQPVPRRAAPRRAASVQAGLAGQARARQVQQAPVRRSTRQRHAPSRLCYELGFIAHW